LAMNLLKDLKENQTNVSHRPAKLFSFDEFRYIELKSKGMSFEL
jgi:8-oxo-dGTP diphosphatase